MARRVSDATKQAAALQAGRRMVSRGERPGYRLQAGQDGSWTVVGLPGVSVTTTDRRGVHDEARAAIAGWLDVDPDAFDVEG